MTKSLFKDLLREIWKSKNRFFSILCIVAIGVGFFSGLRASAPDMSNTIDKYYDEYQTQDIQIISPLGLTPEDIEALREVDGVDKVQPGYLTDVITVLKQENANDLELVFRLHSLPTGYVSGSDLDGFINQVILTEGRLPSAPNEILVQDPKTTISGISGLKVGDTLTFSSGSATKLTDGALHYDTFTIVGLIKTPLYLSYEMGTSQTISNKSINAYAYVPQEAFDFRNTYLEDEEVYLEAVITVKSAKEMNCFDDATYQTLIDKIKSKIENVAVDRATKRGEQLKDNAQKKLDEAQALYEKEKARYEEEIEKGDEKLQKAYKQLVDGEAELTSQKEIYTEKIKTAEAQIKSAERDIANSEVAIEEGEKKYNQALKEYNDALAENKNSIERLDRLAATTDQLAKQSAANRKEIEEKVADPNLPPEIRAEYLSMLGLYQEYDVLIQETNKSIQDLKNGVSTILGVYEESLAAARKTLDQSKKELAQGKKELAKGKSDLAKAKKDSANAFANGRKKLDAGWAEYRKGLATFKKEKISGQLQLESAEKQLADAQRQIDQIESASWFVLDRDSNYGYATYDNTVTSMTAIAKFLPVFFILVAILVCMTTMTRMIDEQRGLIGTYKALGYSNSSISARYIIYVFIASLVGSVIGALVGTAFFPLAVYNAWKLMYSQPANLVPAPHLGVSFTAFAFTTLAMILTAYFVCRSELTSVPATLMRPKAPKLGKEIFLERMPFIWNHFNFSQKVTARNIFRYKKRLCMTIIGIMGCTALLLCGLGMNDTISSVVENQYDEIFKYNISYSYANANASALSSLMGGEQLSEVEIIEQHHAIDEFVSNSDLVDCLAHIGSISVTAENKNNASNTNTESVTLFVTEDADNLNEFIQLRNRGNGHKLELNDTGIIITEKLADRLSLSIGDSIDVTSEQMTKKLEIIGITENYVGHYAYMTQEAYKEAFWFTVEQSTVLVNVKEGTKTKDYEQLVAEIADMPGATSVIALNKLADSFNEQFNSLNSIVMLIIICAALLAFVVLYNLTNINVSERLREIATIKVLGFKNKEVAIYVYSENLILTLMGSVIGLGGGVFLHRFIIKMIEQKNVMFGYVISPFSFFNAILLTCVFSILVMIYMYRSLVNIPMVESLKSVE